MNSHSAKIAKKLSNHSIHLQENVDFRKYPDKDHLTCDTGSQITINHIYGDAIYLIYALVRHGVLSMTSHDYKEIIEIFDIPLPKLSKENLYKSDELLKKTVVNNSALVRFMGDELNKKNNVTNTAPSESSHFFFIMKILERLGSNSRKVEYNIMLSDSNMPLIQYTESERPFLKSPKKIKRRSSMIAQIPLMYIADKTSSSSTSHQEYIHTNNQLSIAIQSLQYFVDCDYITTSDMLYLVNKYYKEHIKILDYSIDPDTKQITVYSHDLLDLNAIKTLTSTLYSKSNKPSPSLIPLIYESNFKFTMHLILEDVTKELHQFIETFKMIASTSRQQETPPANVTFISSKKTNKYDEIQHYDVYYSHDVNTVPKNKDAHEKKHTTNNKINEKAFKTMMVLIKLNPDAFNFESLSHIASNLTDIDKLSSASMSLAMQGGKIGPEDCNLIILLNKANLLNDDNIYLFKNADHKSNIQKFLEICDSVNCPIDQARFNFIIANPSFITDTSEQLAKLSREKKPDKNEMKAELENIFSLSLTKKLEVLKLTDNPSSFFDTSADNYLSTIVKEAAQHPIPKLKLSTSTNQ